MPIFNRLTVACVDLALGAFRFCAWTPIAKAEGNCPPGFYPVGGRGVQGCAPIPVAGTGGGAAGRYTGKPSHGPVAQNVGRYCDRRTRRYWCVQAEAQHRWGAIAEDKKTSHWWLDGNRCFRIPEIEASCGSGGDRRMCPARREQV